MSAQHDEVPCSASDGTEAGVLSHGEPPGPAKAIGLPGAVYSPATADLLKQALLELPVEEGDGANH